MATPRRTKAKTETLPQRDPRTVAVMRPVPATEFIDWLRSEGVRCIFACTALEFLSRFLSSFGTNW